MALNILASPSTADQMTPPRFARYEMNTDADAPAPTHVTPQSDDSRPSLESDESSPNRAALGHPQDKRDAGFEFDASMQVTAADNEDPDSSSENDEECDRWSIPLRTRDRCPPEVFRGRHPVKMRPNVLVVPVYEVGL